MRAFLKLSGRGVLAGRLFPLVLLALPNCTNDYQDFKIPKPAFDPGPEPQSSAVMCDIPHPPANGIIDCAIGQNLMDGMRMAEAAVGLNLNHHNSLVLDYSEFALGQCNGPGLLDFFGFFPDGKPVCLNCGTQMPAVYPDAHAACVAKCVELNATAPPFDGHPGGAQQFCGQSAHVSTNFEAHPCYDNICTSSGTPNAFVDPRRAQEPVTWTEQNGTDDQGGESGSNLERTALPSGNFDAGGYSTQCVQSGDAWVEFQVSTTTAAYAVGFSPMGNAAETLADIPFALVLKADATLEIRELGIPVAQNLGPYTAGQRFRVKLRQKDGSLTAVVSAVSLSASCSALPDGSTPATCVETPIGPTSSMSPSYPLEVDASLVDQDAILQNVTMMRIKGDDSKCPSAPNP